MECKYCNEKLNASSVRNCLDGIVVVFYCKKCCVHYREEIENGRICVYDEEGKLLDKIFVKPLDKYE